MGEAAEEWKLHSNGSLRYKDQIVVPRNQDIKEKIMDVANRTRFTMHPGSTKLYKDPKRMYYWRAMKREIARYVGRCVTCQQVKAEHQKPAGMLQPLQIPEWKWEFITMDFVTNLPKSPRGHNGIWVIVDRLTKSAHFLPIKMNSTIDYFA